MNKQAQKENFPSMETEGVTKPKMPKSVKEIIFSTLITIMMTVMMLITKLTQFFGMHQSAGL